MHKLLLQLRRSYPLLYNGHRSLRNEISCGVPQGSILGPLFFLLDINEINNASNLLNLILFADDTNVFMSHKDLNYRHVRLDMLNLEMDKVSICFKANKLCLNLKKTKFIVFKPRQKRTICNIQISIKTFSKDRSVNLPQFKT